MDNGVNFGFVEEVFFLFLFHLPSFASVYPLSLVADESLFEGGVFHYVFGYFVDGRSFPALLYLLILPYLQLLLPHF